MALFVAAAAGGAGAPSTSTLADHFFYDNPLSMRHLTDEQRSLINSCIMTARSEKNAGDLVTDLVSDTPFKSAFWVNRDECTYQDWGYAALRALFEGLISEETAMDVTALACLVEEFTYSSSSLPPVCHTKAPTAGIPLDKPAFKALLPVDEKYGECLSYIFRAFGEAHQREIDKKIAKLSPCERAIFVINLPTSPVDSWSPLYQAIIKTLRDRHCPCLHLALLERGSRADGSADARFFLHPTFALMKIALSVLSTTAGIRNIQLIPTFGSPSAEEKASYKASFARSVHLTLPCLSLGEVSPELPIHQASSLLYNEHLLITDLCIYPLHRYALNRLYGLLQAAPPEMRSCPDFRAALETLIDAECLSTHPRIGPKPSFFSLFDTPSFASEGARAVLQLIFKEMAEHQEFWDAIFTTEDLAHEMWESIRDLRSITEAKKLSLNDLSYIFHIPVETLVEVSGIIEGGGSSFSMIEFVSKLEQNIDSLARRLFLLTETDDLHFFVRDSKPSAHTFAFLLSLPSENLAALKVHLTRFPCTIEMIANLFHHFFNIEERLNRYMAAAAIFEIPLREGLIPYNHPLLLKGHANIISFLSSHLDQVILPLPTDLGEYVFCKNDYHQIVLYLHEGTCHVISSLPPSRRAMLKIFLNDLITKNDICMQFKNPRSRLAENRDRLAFICEAIAEASDETFAKIERLQIVIRLDLFYFLQRLVWV